MRSPVDYVLQRIGGMKLTEVARRSVPCYKLVPEDGEEPVLCLLVDRTPGAPSNLASQRALYRFPHEDLSSKSGIGRGATGMRGLGLKLRYIRGDMEHLRLREFQPGVCRYVQPRRAEVPAAR